MATNSQGLSVSWGGSTLGEVVSVSLDGISSDTVDVTPRTSTVRFKQWSAGDTDAGSLSVTLRSFDHLYVASVGGTNSLAIVGGDPASTLLNLGDALLQSLAWSATVGELQEYRVVFKLSSAQE